MTDDTARRAAEQFISSRDFSSDNWTETSLAPDDRHVRVRMFCKGNDIGAIDFTPTQWDRFVETAIRYQGMVDRNRSQP